MKPSRGYRSPEVRSGGIDTAAGSNALAYLGAVLLAVSVACVLGIAALDVPPLLTLAAVVGLQVGGGACLLASLTVRR